MVAATTARGRCRHESGRGMARHVVALYDRAATTAEEQRERIAQFLSGSFGSEVVE